MIQLSAIGLAFSEFHPEQDKKRALASVSGDVSDSADALVDMARILLQTAHIVVDASQKLESLITQRFATSVSRVNNGFS